MESENKEALLEATAECSARPSAPASVNVRQNVRLTGTHNFTVSNPGGSAIAVTVEAVLEDTAGHRFLDTRPVNVRAGSTETGTMDSFLVTSYDAPGNVTVTARTRVTGAAFCSSASGQNMRVV